MYEICLRPGIICRYVVLFIEKSTSLNAISNGTPIYPIPHITISVKLPSLSIPIISKKIQYIEVGKGQKMFWNILNTFRVFRKCY